MTEGKKVDGTRTKEIVKVSYKGIAVNLVLVAFKAFVGLLANSIAVILDAVNNLSDALSSVITIVGTKLAGRAPDKKHPYGYGRIEYITSSIIAVIVLAAGVTSLKESIEKVIAPSETSYTAVSLVIIAAAVATKFLLGRYFGKKGRELNSASLSASGTDAVFDSIISLATLVSALINVVFHLNLEGILGVIISLFILMTGIEIMRDTMNDIIGVRAGEELSAKVKEKINSFPGVHGSYDLILHSYGPEENFASVHVEVDDDMTARQFDELTRQIVPEVYREYGVLLTIGLYATNTYNETSQQIKETARREIAKYPQILQMHGFYVDENRKQVSMDLIFDFKETDRAAIAETIKRALEKEFPDYGFHIVLDRDFSD